MLDSTGAAVKGTTVTLTGPGGTMTDTTADDGCAVFQTSTVGSWTASINQAGYVDFYGNQNATKNVTHRGRRAVPGHDQLRQGRDRDVVTQNTQGGYNAADHAAVAHVRQHRVCSPPGRGTSRPAPPPPR